MSKPPSPTGVMGSSRELSRLWGTVIAGDLAFLMARAHAISLLNANAALAEFGLQVRSYSVLALAAEDARPTQRELSAFFKLDPSQVVSIIDRLESRNWVRREVDPGDRRVNVVVATDAGRALYGRAREAARIAEGSAFAALSTADQAVLSALVRRIASSAD
ncbi:MarR family winged helix-turn-helix transcriptional regulator [Arthrobacter jiangjiafuii]|nr:MarR family transcriptional regulator [Arthrobacter jiangjiafuii]